MKRGSEANWAGKTSQVETMQYNKTQQSIILDSKMIPTMFAEVLKTAEKELINGQITFGLFQNFLYTKRMLTFKLTLLLFKL